MFEKKIFKIKLISFPTLNGICTYFFFTCAVIVETGRTGDTEVVDSIITREKTYFPWEKKVSQKLFFMFGTESFIYFSMKK